ncbi:hypothetical protein ACFLY4_09745 [Chloroflexota bacterium]
MGTFICSISERDWTLSRRLGIYGNKIGRVRDDTYREFAPLIKYSIIRDLVGMNVGDKLFFHVISPNGSRVHGIYQVRQEPYFDQKLVWDDDYETFPYRFLYEPCPEYLPLCNNDASIHVPEFYELIESGAIWTLATLENERNIESRSVRKIEGADETGAILRLLHRDFHLNQVNNAEPFRLLENKQVDVSSELRNHIGNIGRYENAVKANLMYRLGKDPASIIEEFADVSDFMNEVFIAQTTRKSIDILCIRNKPNEARDFFICEVKTDLCDERSLEQVLYYKDLFVRNKTYNIANDNVIGCLIGKRFSQETITYARALANVSVFGEVWLLEYNPINDGNDAGFRKL